MFVAPLGEPFTERVVIGRSDAPVATTEVFKFIEGVTGKVALLADELALPLRPPRLRAVFDHLQVMFTGEPHERPHVAGTARQMHRHDGSRLGRDPTFHIRRIKIDRIRFHVGKYRHELLVENANHRAHVGNRGHDHFGSRFQFQRRDRNVDRCRSRRTRHAVFERIRLPKPIEHRRRLRTLPIEQRLLLHHLGQRRQLFLPPTLTTRDSMSHRSGTTVDGQGGGRFDVLAHHLSQRSAFPAATALRCAEDAEGDRVILF